MTYVLDFHCAFCILICIAPHFSTILPITDFNLCAILVVRITHMLSQAPSHLSGNKHLRNSIYQFRFILEINSHHNDVNLGRATAVFYNPSAVTETLVCLSPCAEMGHKKRRLVDKKCGFLFWHRNVLLFAFALLLLNFCSRVLCMWPYLSLLQFLLHTFIHNI